MISRRPLDKATLRAELLEAYSGSLQDSSDGHDLVDRLKYGVIGLASHFGLRAASDYRLQQTESSGSDERLDVVWLAGSAPVAAFEISAEPAGDSVRRLLSSPAELRFWIYTGSEVLSFFARQVDTQGLVSIIPDPSAPGTDASKTLTEQDTEGQFTADQHIRQAIQQFVMASVEEDRSLERTKRGVATLLWRALNKFAGDAKSFGFAEEGPSTESKRRARIRAEHARAYARWTNDEDSLLRLRFTEGASVEELSKVLRRQPSGILSRLQKLGLTTDEPAG